MIVPPLHALAQVADTVVMVAARGPLETVSAVADVVLALFMIVFVAGLSLFLLQARRLNRTVQELGNRMQRHVDPVLDRGRVVLENAEYVSAAVRHDVEKLNDSVRQLKERLDLASRRMEERVEEFNALMEVVQGEAEDIFLDTAAAVQGVKAGARTLKGGRRGGGPPVRTEHGADLEAPEAAAEAGVHVTGRRPAGAPAREAGGAD